MPSSKRRSSTTSWNGLIADGGEEIPCGWLKDRDGLSSQIVPDRMMEPIGDPDPGRSLRDALRRRPQSTIARSSGRPGRHVVITRVGGEPSRATRTTRSSSRTNSGWASGGVSV